MVNTVNTLLCCCIWSSVFIAPLSASPLGFIGCFWFLLEHSFNANDLFRSSLIYWTNQVVLMICDFLLNVLVQTNFIVACSMPIIANWVLRSEIDFSLPVAFVAGCGINFWIATNSNKTSTTWQNSYCCLLARSHKHVLNLFEREASMSHPGPKTKKRLCLLRILVGPTPSFTLCHVTEFFSAELSFQFETFLICLLSLWDNLEGMIKFQSSSILLLSLLEKLYLFFNERGDV